MFEFCDWIDYSYSKEYEERSFDESLLSSGDEKRVNTEELKSLYEDLSSKDKRLAQILQENEELRKQMSEERKYHNQVRGFHVDTISEAKTREMYIDMQL